MVAKTPDAAARSLAQIADRLRDGDAIRDAFGDQIAADARAAGARAGQPRQAHLVAGAIRYGAGKLTAESGAAAGHGTVGELLMGAVFGSERFTQFGPRTSGGYWLFPQLRDPSPASINAIERTADELIRGAI